MAVKAGKKQVLILIVVEDGLVQIASFLYPLEEAGSLNPYCSGRWSRTNLYLALLRSKLCLNPYCSGRWSRTTSTMLQTISSLNCLNPYCSGRWSRTLLVSDIATFNAKS